MLGRLTPHRLTLRRRTVCPLTPASVCFTSPLRPLYLPPFPQTIRLLFDFDPLPEPEEEEEALEAMLQALQQKVQ